eukprot:m51a1_g7132 hypothetical protein (306) ;mRNA; r:258458-261564
MTGGFFQERELSEPPWLWPSGSEDIDVAENEGAVTQWRNVLHPVLVVNEEGLFCPAGCTGTPSRAVLEAARSVYMVKGLGTHYGTGTLVDTALGLTAFHVNEALQMASHLSVAFVPRDASAVDRELAPVAPSGLANDYVFHTLCPVPPGARAVLEAARSVYMVKGLGTHYGTGTLVDTALGLTAFHVNEALQMASHLSVAFVPRDASAVDRELAPVAPSGLANDYVFHTLCPVPPRRCVRLSAGRTVLVLGDADHSSRPRPTSSSEAPPCRGHFLRWRRAEGGHLRDLSAVETRDAEKNRGIGIW